MFILNSLCISFHVWTVGEACDENNLLSFESLKEISEIDEMLSSEACRKKVG